MNNISVDDVLFIHDYILEKSGGLSGIRDRGLLESAILKPHTHVFGIERHESLFDKAAALLEAIALFHPFIDGNKRTAMAAAGFFLYLNGYETTFTNSEYEEFMIYVVNHKPKLKTIATWLEKHSSKF
ncbi:type II toxin-antitoxin system death-on-curing family toxin [Candidatus Saccharibacteria bacterium]|nr:type II toxin-antitoxin system death-on-curing family toxin [Candidatus Saccharibacteria bacterium]